MNTTAYIGWALLVLGIICLVVGFILLAADNSKPWYDYLIVSIGAFGILLGIILLISYYYSNRGTIGTAAATTTIVQSRS
jgi:hypothetical protein